MDTCAVCGYENVVGTLFCEGCGSGLTPEAQGHRYSTGTVGGSAAAANAASRPAAQRFSTGDVAERAAPPEAASARKATDAAPLLDSAPHTDPGWAHRVDPYPGPDPGRDPEHAAIIGADTTWAATEQAAPAASPGTGTGLEAGIGTGPVAPGTSQPTQAPLAHPADPTASVYLVSESGRRVDVPAQDVVIVGREDMRSGIRPDVDLTLDGASAAGVSRRHCRLLRQADGWYVEDLMSTNFTVLNGKALPPHTPTHVLHGDELRLGKLRLRFQQG